MRTRLWSTVPVLLGILLSSPFQTAASHRGNMPSVEDRRERNQQRMSARRNTPPSGISVVNLIDTQRRGRLFDTSDPALNAYVNPNTSGLTFRTSWADVEPRDGKFDFSKIDVVFDNAEKNRKWVELILIPGFGTPAWAMHGVQSGTFAIQYGPGAVIGTSLPLPVPWDQTYLSRWFTFLKAIADRYADRPSFRLIAAAGPTSVSSEMSLPDAPNEIEQWKKLGYTGQKYVDAWKRTFNAYSSIFPHQYFSLSLHPALPIPDSRQKAYVRGQIIDLGLRFTGQFALDSQGLNSFRSDRTLELVTDHIGQVVTGFVMSTAATERSERMGAEGNPSLALRRSIDTGMRPSRAGQHVDYLGIYEPDALTNDMQPVLRYGASLFSR